MSILKHLINKNPLKTPSIRLIRCSSTTYSDVKGRVLEQPMKKSIEEYWRNKLSYKRFDTNDPKNKFYVLSMFPYPSGQLHMGHVRVYTISDAMARFYRLNGKNVFHPMGWDSFGLPAENAAIQRNIPAEDWTKQNIEHMKKQLTELGCSFDWQAELATCDPSYYKWTQKLFLMLFKENLVYQREATVNWDPVDLTVLADEQVDANGCSWRSGAKVEKKLLKQWFIRTTKLSQQLLHGLDDPILQDWRDIVKLQKHWIGECDGWHFELKAGGRNVTIWSKKPQDFIHAGFVAIKKENFLNENNIDEGLLDIVMKNPFGRDLPIVVTNDVEFPPFNDFYLGVPTKIEADYEVAVKYDVRIETMLPLEEFEEDQQWVLEKAQDLGIGGDYKVSSKLRDWLISRQRFWGTPIPIIHCSSCGPVAVNDKELPVKLPDMKGNIGKPLRDDVDWLKCSCPKCGSADAKRESDTMDTFVDSSWYYLRYLDAQNQIDIADKKITRTMMPVDIYIGGKEHAVLHLYYARFMNHFLNQQGYVNHPEPFKRLLVQGMVMGKSYRLKGTGQYLKESEVEVVDAKKGKAIEKSSGKPVIMLWEKMSKSKFNGVDPAEVINEYGCDTIRLISLADVAPTSHRNWSDATFPGVINWQRRLWLTIHDFMQAREKSGEVTKTKEFDEQEHLLLNAVNYFTSGATFNFQCSHQISVAISKMQGLTNSIRRATPDVVALSANYERALAAQIIMLAPLAPHLGSELWARFISAQNRVTASSPHINWDGDVFNQHWPKVDSSHEVELTVKANNVIFHSLKITCGDLNKMSEEQALFMALSNKEVNKYIQGKKVEGTSWIIQKDYEGIITFNIDRSAELEKQKAESLAKQVN